MFTAVIKIFHLLTMMVEARLNADKLVFQLDNNRKVIIQTLLFEWEHVDTLDDNMLYNYINDLGSALKETKRQFPKDKAIIKPLYNVIDEICTEMLDFSGLLSKMRKFSQGKEWCVLLDSFTKVINHCSIILKILVKNDALPLKNELFPDGEKKKFSSGLLHGLILEELLEIEVKKVVVLKMFVLQMFHSIYTAISIAWDSRTKTFLKLDDKSYASLHKSIEDALRDGNVVSEYLKYLRVRNIINDEKFQSLYLLLYLIEYIPRAFTEYRKIIISLTEGMNGNVMKYFREYNILTVYTVINMFYLAIHPKKVNEFIKKIKNNYSEVMKKGDSLIKINPNQEHEPSNVEDISVTSVLFENRPNLNQDVQLSEEQRKNTLSPVSSENELSSDQNNQSPKENSNYSIIILWVVIFFTGMVIFACLLIYTHIRNQRKEIE